MVDYGHQETDKLLESVESKVQKVYSQTEKEVQKKLTAYMKQFESEDKAKLKLLKKGKITQEEYTKWRSVKMLSGQHYQAVLDTLAADYANADKIAMSIVGQHLPEAYAINRNFAAFQVEKGSLADTSFALYDKHTVERLMKNDNNLLPKPRVDIPKDKRWNRAKIREQITKGVLSGDSIPHIADRLQRVTDMDRSAAIRNARTAMTGAQNQGRVDSYKYAQSLGIELEKEWRATLDGKTRHAHRALDGERVPVDGVFSVAGSELEFPGDPNCTDPSLVYNCRCTLVAAIKDVDYSKSERYSKLGDMSYDEWKYEKSVKNVVTSKKSFAENQNRPKLFDLSYAEAKKEMNEQTRKEIEKIVYENARQKNMTLAEYWSAVSRGDISDDKINAILRSSTPVVSETAIKKEGLELYRTFIEGGSDIIHGYAGYNPYSIGDYDPSRIDAEKLKALDSVFSPNKEKRVVYKGVGMTEDEIKKMDGITRVSRSYSSTSVEKSTAQYYAEKAYDISEEAFPVIEKITIEEGVPIADAIELLGEGGMKAMEAEITIGRNVVWDYSEFILHEDKNGDLYYTVNITLKLKNKG